ncbi:hypothetical protein BGZ83_003685 [Gryganskiella cystojenkinii]|nr:hypothetical protein BGZ83_003685 [Gryganskiella cystojenkinii]
MSETEATKIQEDALSTAGTHTRGSSVMKNTAVDVLQLSVPEYARYLEHLHEITLLPPELDTTAKDNMLASRIYDSKDPLLVMERGRANDITSVYNNLDENVSETGPQGETIMRKLTEQEKQHYRNALIHLLTTDSHRRDRNALLNIPSPEHPQQYHQGDLLPRIEPPLQVDYGNNLILGSDCVIGSNFVALDCCLIKIGARTRLGPGCQLLGATHPLNPLLRHHDRHFDFAQPITIGEDCWIGGGTVVCPGVEVGRGCIILEGSVLTKNVPSFTVVAGAPAKIIKVLDQQVCEKEARDFQVVLEAFKARSDATENEAALAGKAWEEWSDNWTPPPRETMELL